MAAGYCNLTATSSPVDRKEHRCACPILAAPRGSQSKFVKGNIEEASIGHALICDTFEFGLQETIKKYLTLTNN